ncbi:MAG: VOC family protein [Chloroflexi bacterium]|nr:VOC family protein [Chloroflexota bacterium]MBI3931766.1 VOC family protein [Chloroflexota bacterium]
MKIEKIGYVTIRVKDLEAAGKLFTDLFGLEFTSHGENPQLDIRNLISPLVELITPLTPAGPVARALEKNGEGLALVSFNVANIEEAAAEMKAKGIRQIWHREKRALFHPRDLYGVMVELVES